MQTLHENQSDDMLIKGLTSMVKLTLWIVCAIVLWYMMKILIFGYFPVPTRSMYPTIIPGDVVFVNKTRLGARTFRSLDFLENDTIPVRNIRFAGIGAINRNDVVVFNYPYGRAWSTPFFNYRLMYVKRCIALPGDTMRIENGFYRIAGRSDTLGYIPAQKRLSNTPDEQLGEYIKAGGRIWTIKDFGPLYVPKKGDTLRIDSFNYYYYKRIIDWETGKKVSRDENGICMWEGKPFGDYVVGDNYYFMAGDNVFDSRDSRFWGLLREEYIVGPCSFILYSKDRNDGTFRWKRLLHTLTPNDDDIY